MTDILLTIFFYSIGMMFVAIGIPTILEANSKDLDPVPYYFFVLFWPAFLVVVFIWFIVSTIVSLVDRVLK